MTTNSKPDFEDWINNTKYLVDIYELDLSLACDFVILQRIVNEYAKTTYKMGYEAAKDDAINGLGFKEL